MKKNGKKKIKLPVTWEVCGIVEVEAKSIEEAIEIFKRDVDHIPLPENCEYVDGSFWLTDDDPEYINGYN